MIKERIPISGDLGSKVKQLMEYAGWYEGRSVDISTPEQYYADHGVPMMKTTQRFYRKYFGLCCEWYLAQKKLKWAADFEFALFLTWSTGSKTIWKKPISGICPAVSWRKSNRLPVRSASPSVTSAITTRQRSGSRSTGNCMRNMSIRIRSSAFQMCLP